MQFTNFTNFLAAREVELMTLTTQRAAHSLFLLQMAAYHARREMIWKQMVKMTMEDNCVNR